MTLEQGRESRSETDAMLEWIEKWGESTRGERTAFIDGFRAARSATADRNAVLEEVAQYMENNGEEGWAYNIRSFKSKPLSTNHTITAAQAGRSGEGTPTKARETGKSETAAPPSSIEGTKP